MRPGTKQTGQQAGHRQVGVQSLAMQTVAGAENLHLGQLFPGGVLQIRGEVRREAERAAVGQCDDDLPTRGS